MNPPSKPGARLLDASAVLALLLGEAGGEMVRSVLSTACISAVNSAEVLAKLVRKGMPVEVATTALDALSLECIPFGQVEAVESARLGHGKGLSLGDRACLATASLRGWPVVTADRGWKNAAPSHQVVLIR